MVVLTLQNMEFHKADVPRRILFAVLLAQQKDLKRSYFLHNTSSRISMRLQWEKTPERDFEDNPSCQFSSKHINMTRMRVVVVTHNNLI